MKHKLVIHFWQLTKQLTEMLVFKFTRFHIIKQHSFSYILIFFELLMVFQAIRGVVGGADNPNIHLL